MKEQLYVIVNEYGGAFVGTLESIKEFIEETEWTLGSCTFYEINKEVQIKLEVQ